MRIAPIVLGICALVRCGLSCALGEVAASPAPAAPAPAPANPGPAEPAPASPPPADAPPTQPSAPPAPPSPPPPAPPEAGPKLVALQVDPPKFTIQGRWSSQSLLVTGRLSDGTIQDVTAKAEFASADGGIAQVSPQGLVRPVADGETKIAVVVKVADASVAAEATLTVSGAQNDAVTFADNIVPLLSRQGCNAAACHGSVKGKAGLRFSLFGGDPQWDYGALTNAAYGRRLNKVEPPKSLLLLKASGSVAHGGGQKTPVGTPEYDMLASWVAQGAPWGEDKAPKVVAVNVSPAERVFQKGETQQLLATAVFADGAQRDATGLARYSSSAAAVASVDANGKIKAEDFGQAAIVVNHMGRAAVVRVIVPQPLSGPFPTVTPNNKIDELVLAKLKTLGIPPADVCADAEFIRRVYLDVIGILPTPDEVRAFLGDADPQKRTKLIDRLLARPEFADFWTLKWGDLLRIKSEYPVNVWPKAVHVYYRTVHQSILRNQPYDQFVRELLTSSGSNFRNGKANYFRAVQQKDPQTFAETTALVFMGARMGCCRCHVHPQEGWTLDDDLGLAAFFSKVSFKATTEWKEEIVFLNPKAALWHPRTKQLVAPKLLGGEVVQCEPEADPREKLAQWLTSPQNPWFAKNVVNRIWYWLVGRGIVHEPDDMRTTNPPQNPELLGYMEQELVAQKFDLKHVYRLVLNSRTYQASSKTTPLNERDLANFSHYGVKRLAAEQLLDVIDQVTETTDFFASWIPVPPTVLPPSYRAAQIFDGDIDSPFLQLFGRPSRDTCYEGDRNLEPSLRQALHLLDSGHIEGKVAGSPRIKRLMESNKSDQDVIDEIYLAALSRLPNDEERPKIVAYLEARKNARWQAVQDLLWAVLNTKEFLSNH